MSSGTGVGIRVKTAKAIAVVLSGSARCPELLLREQLRLWDPAQPESGQPYHAGLGLEAEEARVVVERASAAVRVASRQAFAGLAAELERRGAGVRRVGLVRSSDTDPATVRSPHMHAHAAEGALFYQALAEAAGEAGCACFELLQKRALAEASERLGRDEATLRGEIDAFGKAIGPPWRADEKAACAAAWIALA